MSEAAKGRLDALRGRVNAVREQRQGQGQRPGQGPPRVSQAQRFGADLSPTICVDMGLK